MAINLVNLGTGEDTGDGDKGRVAFGKTNGMFTELYTVTAKSVTALQADGSVDSTGDQKFRGHVGVGSGFDTTSIEANKTFTINETYDNPTERTYGSQISHTISGIGDTRDHLAQEFSITVSADAGQPFTGDLIGARYAPLADSGTASLMIGGESFIVTTGGTITDGRSFQSAGLIVTGTIVDYVGYYATAVTNVVGTAPVNISSLYIEKQTVGTGSNHGLVLAGDDLGADIIFGAGQDVAMHFDGTNMTLEGTGIAAVASTATVNNTIPIDINGTVYHILLSTTA